MSSANLHPYDRALTTDFELRTLEYMAPTSTYRLLVIGTNSSPGAEPLEFAEKDARDVYAALTGRHGHVSADDAVLLVGRAAKCTRLLAELEELASWPPDVLLVYFAGHGNTDGISLADGHFRYSQLRQKLRSIGATKSMLVFDTCHAGALVNFLKSATAIRGSADDDWLRLLADAHPGVRILAATSETEGARENRAKQNGAFTSAFLRALRLATSDLYNDSPQGFVSDLAVFRFAVKLLRAEGFTQTPRQLNVRGDFPVFRGHYGSARVVSVSRELLAEAHIHIKTQSRSHRPIFIKSSLLDDNGRIVKQWKPHELCPQKDKSTYRLRIRIPYLPRACDSVKLQVTIFNKIQRILDHQKFDIEPVNLLEEILAS